MYFYVRNSDLLNFRNISFSSALRLFIYTVAESIFSAPNIQSGQKWLDNKNFHVIHYLEKLAADVEILVETWDKWVNRSSVNDPIKSKTEIEVRAQSDLPVNCWRAIKNWSSDRYLQSRATTNLSFPQNNPG